MGRKESVSLVIFGASGDLTRRKLIPAFYSLYLKKRLPNDFKIFGYSRSRLTDEEFRERLSTIEKNQNCTPPQAGAWDAFSANIHYQSGSFTDERELQKFDKRLRSYEKGEAHRLYYMATPPELFTGIVGNLGKAGMVGLVPI